MTRPTNYRLRGAGLAGLLVALSMPAAAHYGPSERAPFLPVAAVPAVGVFAQSQWVAGAASGVMRVGLTLVDRREQTPLPDPASLDFPATSRAIRCESAHQSYRECPTPFRGPVALAREVSATRCVEDENWGWREGKVWVDGGCAAVFVRIGET